MYLKILVRNTKKKMVFHYPWHYTKRSIFKLAHGLFYMFARRPFLMVLSKYVNAMIYVWLKVKANFNFYIVTNNELTASFIARHITLAYKMGLKWRDVVKPVKRDLNRIMYKLRYITAPKSLGKYNTYLNWMKKKDSTLFEYSALLYKVYLNRYLKSVFNTFIKKILEKKLGQIEYTLGMTDFIGAFLKKGYWSIYLPDTKFLNRFSSKVYPKINEKDPYYSKSFFSDLSFGYKRPRKLDTISYYGVFLKHSSLKFFMKKFAWLNKLADKNVLSFLILSMFAIKNIYNKVCLNLLVNFNLKLKKTILKNYTSNLVKTNWLLHFLSKKKKY